MSGTNGAWNPAPQDPYSSTEFEEFLKLIGENNIRNWSIMAEALGVGRMTIIRWKKHPRAIAALRAAIATSIAGMERAGDEDWKMHREKAKMLGVKDKQTIEHEIDENVEDILDRLETNYARLSTEARQALDGQVVANEPPLQNQE